MTFTPTKTSKGFLSTAILSALLLGACSPGSPEAVVRNFYQSVAKGDVETAKGFLSDQVVQLLGSTKLSTALRQSTKEIDACGGLKSVKVDLDGKGEYREGTSTLEFKGDCSAQTDEVYLVKEDDSWKLAPTK